MRAARTIYRVLSPKVTTKTVFDRDGIRRTWMRNHIPTFNDDTGTAHWASDRLSSSPQ